MIAALALAALLQASPAPPAAGPPLVAFDRPELKGRGPDLTVQPESFAAGGPIPQQYSGYGRNLSPALRWSGAPEKTASFVLIVEDPDAGEGRPLLHWLAYDMAANTTALPAKVRNRPHLEEPAAFSQGLNDHGGIGWTGPHPPEGAPAHPYHFQVFAMDRRSVARPGAEIAEVLAAMRGHVLAKGQAIGFYAQEAEKPRKVKKTARGAAPAANPPAPQP